MGQTILQAPPECRPNSKVFQALASDRLTDRVSMSAQELAQELLTAHIRINGSLSITADRAICAIELPDSYQPYQFGSHFPDSKIRFRQLLNN